MYRIKAQIRMHGIDGMTDVGRHTSTTPLNAECSGLGEPLVREPVMPFSFVDCSTVVVSTPVGDRVFQCGH